MAQLAEGDHEDEHAACGEHDQDDLAPFLRGSLLDKRAVEEERRTLRESNSAGPLDDEVGEVRRALAELPPAVHLRPDERRASPVHERDHGDALGHRVTVGLVEPLEAAAVAPLLPRRSISSSKTGSAKPPSFVRLVDWKSRRR